MRTTFVWLAALLALATGPRLAAAQAADDAAEGSETQASEDGESEASASFQHSEPGGGDEGREDGVPDAPEPYGGPEASRGRQATERVLTTTAADVPPDFILWSSEEHDAFIKPVLQISSTLVGYFPTASRDGFAWRSSTLLLSRFGLEGQLFGFLTFRSVFERNVGWSLARNGPVGTSIWEGQASLQARENYLRIEKWGLSLTGGIFPDPASIDFVSQNILDTFGMDPYVRDPLLISGFNQGQGLMLRYNWEALTFGFSYTGGNPLVTSLAFGYGGTASSLGSLFSAPLRAFSNGFPGSNIHVNIVSPSFGLETEYFDVKLASQHYFIDQDVTIPDEDPDPGGESTWAVPLRGYNLRGTFQVKLLDERIRIMGSAAYRRNQQVASVTNVEELSDFDYEALLFSGGFDLVFGDFSFGGNYYYIVSRTSEAQELRNHYVNVGATYWLLPPNFSIGLRWARSMAEQDPTPVVLEATDSFILSMRLLI